MKYHPFFSQCTLLGKVNCLNNKQKIQLIFSGPDGEAARFPSDPLVDEEILEQMEEIFYRDDFDPSLHVLKVG